MQVFRSREKVGDLTKLNITSVELAASTLTIGGRQYTTGILTCDLSTSGVGGLDIGVVAANSVYYVYAVSQTSLIASLSIVNPVGYIGAKYVGAIQTDNAAEIIMVSQKQDFDGDWIVHIPSFAGMTSTSAIDFKVKRNGSDWVISGTFTPVSPQPSELQITLPSATIVSSNSPAGTSLRGMLSRGDASAEYSILATSGDAFINAGSTVTSMTPTNGSTIFSSGVKVGIFCRIPVEGWSEKINRTVEGR